MFSWLAILQLPLLYLPLMVVGLGVWGSDFDELPGRLFIGTFLLLPLVDLLLGRRWERAACGLPGTLLPLLGVLLAGLAYRPVHLGYWDEHSAAQALPFCVLGLCSWGVSRAGVARLREDGAGAPPALAGAFLLLGVCWWSTALYPLLPTLGLGAIFAVLVVAWPPRTPEAPAPPRWSPPRTTALLAFGALLLGLDLFLVVWDYRHDSSWAWHLFAAFGAAGVGALLGGRIGQVVLLLGAINFALLAVHRPWVLQPAHSIIAGLALGVLLERTVRRGSSGSERRAPLGAWSVFWVLGLVLGLTLYQNLAFAGWRVLLLLPPLVLLVRARRQVTTPPS